MRRASTTIRNFQTWCAALSTDKRLTLGGCTLDGYKIPSRPPGLRTNSSTRPPFRAINRHSGPDFGRTLIEKTSKSASGWPKASRKADFEVFSVRVRPKSGPEGRFLARNGGRVDELVLGPGGRDGILQPSKVQPPRVCFAATESPTKTLHVFPG